MLRIKKVGSKIKSVGNIFKRKKLKAIPPAPPPKAMPRGYKIVERYPLYEPFVHVAIAQNPDGSVKIKVTFFGDVARETARRLIVGLGGAVESEFAASPSFWISIDPTQIRALIQQDAVQFVGFYPPPSETINAGSTAWTGADNVQALGITGAGVTVSLWDGNEADDGHGDLAGRVVFGTDLPAVSPSRGAGRAWPIATTRPLA